MTLFNRLISQVQRKKEVGFVREDVWTQHSKQKPVQGSLRVILFRDCERKGKKLLFDSMTVERKELSNNMGDEELDEFTEVGEGVGFKYLQPPHKDVKQISDMIFGSAAVAYQPSNLKIHQLGAENSIMWSSIVPAPRIRKGGGGGGSIGGTSDSSLNSSFGCSIGSLQGHITDDVYPPPHLHNEVLHSTTGSTSDSGCYSSYALSSTQASFSSSLDPDPEFPPRRRLSSNADTPDFGSLCSLQRRWLSAVEGTLSHSQLSSPMLPDQSGQIAGGQFTFSPAATSENIHKQSKSVLSLHGDNLKSGSRNALLGLAIIISPPDERTRDMLFKRNLVIEDIFNDLLHSVQHAYIHKKRFVSTMWSGWLEMVRGITGLYTVTQMTSTTWHLAISRPGEGMMERLVMDMVTLRQILDTKETNFFFSSLLTGVLTHHLGWVETVMPSTEMGDNSLNKPGAKGLEQFGKDHWYSPTRLQFRELHGMLGHPVRSAKTLVMANNDELTKKMIFVLSYFIRCSQIFEQDMKDSSPSKEEMKVKSYTLTRSEAMQSPNLNACQQNPSSRTNRSSSSPDLKLDPFHPISNIKKSHSYICSVGGVGEDMKDGDGSDREENRVNFLIGGEDEKLNIECDKMFDDQVFITKATKTTMVDVEEEEEEEEERIEIIELPFFPATVTGKSPAPVTSLICCSDFYMPGTVLQGCYGPIPPGDQWRTRLQSDLLASSCNLFTSPLTEEVVCVVGEVDRGEVSLVSAQQVVVGRPGLPVPMSPLVAGMLDSLVISASLQSLPASVILNQVEDHLQQMYLQSCILAEYLLSVDFINLQSIASILDLDPCDIPLLLAVASTHTPLVGQKFGLSFTG